MADPHPAKTPTAGGPGRQGLRHTVSGGLRGHDLWLEASLAYGCNSLLDPCTLRVERQGSSPQVEAQVVQITEGLKRPSDFGLFACAVHIRDAQRDGILQS